VRYASVPCDDCGSIRAWQQINGCYHSKKTVEGETKPGMGINWDQFQEGDEVAVTLVGTWRGDRPEPALATPTGFLLQVGRSLAAAVDAYRIEPDYKPGDMVRDWYGGLWRKVTDGRWMRLDVDAQYSVTVTPPGAVRVKVVDA